jgi:hypothetical protein
MRSAAGKRVLPVIDNLILRLVVALLFVATSAGLVYLIGSDRHRWTAMAGHALHIVMSAAMLTMAWPAGARLPTVGPMMFFALAAAWFVAMAILADARPGRVANVYHVLMMSAMAWMYAVMNGRILPGQSKASAAGHAGSGMNMPDMAMPGMKMPQANTVTAGPTAPAYPTWITVIDWIWTVGFALAAAVWLYFVVAQRYKGENHGTYALVRPACQAMMAAGMATVFAVML